VICIDTKHALSVASMLEKVSGERPTVVVCDDKFAEGSIDKYAKGTSMWIVAVRMVSEGVDIKRLAVLAYLTNATTELFFRQAIGRVVRRDRLQGRRDKTAYCILPEDPRLTALAEKIKEFQAAVPDDAPGDPKPEAGGPGGPKPQIDVVGSSDAEYKGTIFSGEVLDARFAREARTLAGGSEFAEAEIIKILRRGMELSAVVEAQAPEKPGVPLEERLALLRQQCSSLANKIAYRKGREEREIHSQYKATVDSTPQAKMDEKQLQRKKEWLSRQLNRSAA
jgi:superfamily II DNA or RNA helicase